MKSSKELGIDDSVSAIENAGTKELEAGIAYKETQDPEERQSLLEDGYLQRLIQVRESRLMGKKAYDDEACKAVVGLDYDDLFICEFEEYNFEDRERELNS